MQQQTIILAVIILAILVIGAIVWWRMREKKGTYVPQPAAQVWDPSVSGAYACPTGYTTAASGYCILPSSQAPTACSADSKCVGYLIPGAGSAWATAYPGDAQLVPVPPTAAAGGANYGNVVFYQKKA